MKTSPYRIMWVMTFFDLPTETKPQRKAYTKFRKSLLKDGFTMLQYSVYMRHTASIENMETHIRVIENNLPKQGKVSVLEITDKQFERIRHYWGVERVPAPETPQQLAMF